jgi:hemerythrin-like domain-containing protein
MKITDALLGEHAVLYDLFSHLRNTAVTSNDVAEIRAAVAVVDRLLLAHARIEEALLFPRLDPHLGQMGPLAIMRSEHQGIEDLLEAARGETDLASLKSLIGRLLELASGHFRKEEMVLFGMAQQFLGDDVLNELGEEWATSRKVSLGGGGCMAAG